MKYLIILIGIFFIFSCNNDNDNINDNPLLINQCEIDSDCKDEIKPECNFVFDKDNNTKRFECTPYKCSGWTGITGQTSIISYYMDLDNNCNKHMIDKKEK